MKALIPLISRLVIYSITMLGVVLITRLDFMDAQILENSAIEISQETLLGLSAVILFYFGLKHSDFKIFNLALSGVLAVHFVREFDFWLNYNLFDKSWQVFAGIFIILTLFLIFRHFKRFILELTQISKTYAFAIFFIGFIILHAFSRLFGSKKVWSWLLEPMHSDHVSTVYGKKSISLIDYVYPVKTGVQESIELLAYSIMFIGVVEMIIFGIQSSRKIQA